MKTDHILLGTIRGVAFCALLVLLAFPPAACFEMGASDNQEQTGWQDRGRDPGNHELERQWDPKTGETTWVYDLEYSDIILSPDGQRLLAMVPAPGPDKGWDEPGLVLVAQTLPAGRVEKFPELMNLVRVNFSPDGKRAYALKEGGREIAIIDLEDFDVIGTHGLDEAFSVLDVSPDGRFIALTNLPTTDVEEILFDDSCYPSPWRDLPSGANLCELALLDLETEEHDLLKFDEPLRDLDFSPDSSELLLTWSKSWMVSVVTFYDTAAGEVIEEVSVPNCVDELVLQPGGELALMAPTRCAQDPISVLDLKERAFVKNLPGFGPVEITPDGSTAVGFTRRNDMVTQWGYQDQEAPYGLIIVDLPSLEWQVLDYGDTGPTFTVSPDGGYLYLYGYSWYHGYQNFEEVDLSDLSRRKVTGGDAGLNRFVWTPDGEYLFTLMYGNLFRVAVGEASAVKVMLDEKPELINVRPQGDYLLLGEYDRPRFYLLGLQPVPLFSEFDIVI